MKDIAVIDIETGNSTMSLQDLNSNIVSNARAITSNNTLLGSKLNTNDFNSNLGENLKTYYETITDNLNIGKLVYNLREQNVEFKNVNS